MLQCKKITRLIGAGDWVVTSARVGNRSRSEIAEITAEITAPETAAEIRLGIRYRNWRLRRARRRPRFKKTDPALEAADATEETDGDPRQSG